MAYEFASASSQYISSIQPVAGGSITFSCVAYLSDISTDYVMMGLTKNNDYLNARVTMLFAQSQSNVLMGLINAGGGTRAPKSGSALSASTLYSCVLTHASTSRNVYLNGVAGIASTTTDNVSGFNTFLVGAHDISGVTGYFNGRLSEAAIWSVALTDAEITSLSKGFKPTRIRPQSLVFYAPLLRNLQDVKGALTLTNNNSATVADHPRVY